MKRSSRGRGAQRQVVIIILLLLLLLLLLFSEVRERKKEKKKRDSHVSAINCAARCSPSVRWRPGYYFSAVCARTALLCACVRMERWEQSTVESRLWWCHPPSSHVPHRRFHCLLLLLLFVVGWFVGLRMDGRVIFFVCWFNKAIPFLLFSRGTREMIKIGWTCGLLVHLRASRRNSIRVLISIFVLSWNE